MTMEDAILYAEENNNIYLRAVGRITAPLCTECRKRVYQRLEREPFIQTVYLDLATCNYMDSTFMGIIIGINKKLKVHSAGSMVVICPTTECNLLFASLNLTSFLEIDHNRPSFPNEMELISRFEKPSAEIVLKAHDELAEISEANATKFKLLREMLQEKIKDQTNEVKEESLNSTEEIEPLNLNELKEDESTPSE